MEQIYNNYDYAKSDDRKILFDDVVRKWLNSKKHIIKESSYMRYLQVINTYIMPHFEKMYVDEITTDDLNIFLRYLLSAGRADHMGGLASKTVSDIVMILKSVFAFAQRNGVDVRCDFQALKVRNKEKKVNVLTINEQMKLTKQLLNNTSREKMGILLSLYTGMRIGEICALRCGDIDLNEGIIHVNKTLQRVQTENADKKTKVIITTPKSESSVRDIPLPQVIKENIGVFLSANDTFLLTGLTDKYTEPRTLQNHFKRCMKECGVSAVKFHCLRHTFATRCIEIGFDVKTLSEILGHTSVNITLNKYVHSSMEMKRKNMEKLDRISKDVGIS